MNDATSSPTAAQAPGAVVRTTEQASELNRILQVLPAEEYALLRSHLVRMPMKLRYVMIEAGKPIEHVYFLREGVGSMIATEQDGGDIEVGTVGRDGIVGLPIVFGVDTSPNKTIIQVEGDGWVMPAAVFRRLL